MCYELPVNAKLKKYLKINNQKVFLNNEIFFSYICITCTCDTCKDILKY